MCRVETPIDHEIKVDLEMQEKIRELKKEEFEIRLE